MSVLLVVIGFLGGILFIGAMSYTSYAQEPDWAFESPNDGLLTGMVAGVAGVPERLGPKDRIPERAIAVYGDRVVLDIKGAQWSTFTNTNSMDPILDDGANAIQVVPATPQEIQVGDIISYESEYAQGTIIHRVVYKGEDELGTYFIAKGDNLPASDPGRIRFDQIKRVVVAIIY